MITGRGHPLTQEHAEAGKYAPLMMFDCRGYEPVDFVFGSGWKAESVSIDFSLHRIKLRIVFSFWTYISYLDFLSLFLN